MTDISHLPAAATPQQAMAIVAPPRLWDGDDPAGYDMLRTQMSGAVAPKDFLEEIWTRDAVDMVWEIFRLRRFKSELMREAAYKGVLAVIEPRRWLIPERTSSWKTAMDWACGDRDAAAAIEHVLATSGLTMDTARAKTFSKLIDRFECIDRMTMMAEGRRDTVLREIERHRESFSKRLRHAIVVAEDAEFKVLATQD